jgi:hypothetical protein
MRIVTPLAGAVALLGLTIAGCGGGPTGTAPHAARAPVTETRISPVTDISSACPGQNAEVEEATAPPHYVYAEWIGCGGIGFARSTDGGLHWSKPVTVPGSAGSSWDPAVTVAPNGTVYASYMHGKPSAEGGRYMYPGVAASFNHGASFPQVSSDLPPAPGNWGDRDFIAAARDGKVYLTWDYGPSAAEVKLLCSRSGSCAYANGDLNAVIQTSDNGGRTWGRITHLEPGFPLGGGYSAPLVVRPDGTVDVLYIGHPTDQKTLKLHPGYEFFTSSRDATQWPATPLKLWPGKGTLSLPEWWIDGDISTDRGGNLYATWDTQTAAGDIGWLTYSGNGGRTWSSPVRVTPDTDNAPHIVESAGGQPGVAYMAWQTSAANRGYATYLRPFSISHGWLGPAIKVSARYGKTKIWPGDTFGIALLPGGQISVTWGSAVGTSKNSEIYSSVVTGD